MGEWTLDTPLDQPLQCLGIGIALLYKGGLDDIKR